MLPSSASASPSGKQPRRQHSYPRRDGRFPGLSTPGCGTADPSGEAAELAALRGQANVENVLYYAARLWHQAHPQPTVKAERAAEEEERGIVSVAPVEGADAC